jgi:hypothetical protein
MSMNLETINSSLFQPLNAEEAAMVLGGQALAHTFVDNGDGSYTYVGEDMIIKQAPTA